MTLARDSALPAAFAAATPVPARQVRNVLAGLQPWWIGRVRRAGLPDEWFDLGSALEARPPAPLPPFESRTLAYDAWELGSLYVSSLDSADRSEHGRHYTPRDLAELLWSMTRTALGFGVDDHALPGLVRDPAVGAGALLVPVIREHLRASSDVDPLLVLSALPNYLEGIDNDPWAAYVANVVLAAEMLPTLAKVPVSLRRPLPVIARVGDGLDKDLPPAHAWIMNPPYGRLKLSPERRGQFADILYGHANLYSLFIGTSIRNIPANGVVGALVPTSFSSGLYFSRLRERLSDRAPLRSLAFVQERNGVFGGVLQETCLAVFSPKRAQRVQISRVDSGVTSVASVPSPRTDRPWLLPRESSDAALAAAASRLPLTLESAGWHASTGPLVWNRRKTDLFKRPSRTREMVIWAADIDGGSIHRDKSRDQHRYLRVRRGEESVMVLTEPAILVQRTTSPEQKKRLVVVDLDEMALARTGGRLVVENHLNVLRPVAQEPLISRVTLARVLSSVTFDRLMRCISGSVAVSSYELGALPLPSAEVLASWEGLDDRELESAVEHAYRLPGRS